MRKVSAKKIWLISVLVLLAAIIISLSVYTYSSDKIFAGVKCGDISLSHMTAKEAEAALRDGISKDYKTQKITLILDGSKKELSLGDIGVSYDMEQTAQSAMLYGREGGFFKRIKDVLFAMLGGRSIDAKFAYDKNALDSEVSQMLDGIGTPVKEYSYEIKDNKFYIINGTPGDMPDKSFVSSEILKAAANLSFGDVLEFEKETRNPKDVDVDALYREVSGEVENASYEYSGGEVMIKPHKYGVEFDVNEAKKIVSDNKDFGKRYQIPAKISSPDFLEEQAKERLFSQTIGSYKSNYNQGDVSRSSNVALAAKLINGTIIMPGAEFSYNTIVGKRTEEAGFKVAHVYMNNEVVDGIGGGICQVSSTLYCAVLYANLDVTERVNHQLPVNYVPLGQDATVDYGNIDFRFINNTGYPLRVLAHASGGTMYASIEGFKETHEDVEIIPVRIASIPPTVVEEEDDTLPIGEKKEAEVGSDGSVVETYKVVTVNGKSERTLISKSTYAAGKTIVKVGTNPDLKPAEEDEGEEASSETSETDKPTSPSTEGEAAPASPTPLPTDNLMSQEELQNLAASQE